MSKVLIAYSTVDGQTLKISQRISEEIKEEVVIKSFEEIKSLIEYDKIIVASSIRYGKFPKSLYKFVESNQQQLEEKQADFFGVNLIARTPEKCLIENNVYVRKFLESISWEPHHVEIFAGALKYTKYRAFDKLMIRLIMKKTGGPTDTKVDTEFTNWNQVSYYASRVQNELC